MKIQIRRGTFETNSSSMHSLVICNNYDNDRYYTKEELEAEIDYYINKKGIFNGKGTYTIFPGWGGWTDSWYFGRYPMFILNRFVEKFAYAYATGRDKETLEEIIKEYSSKIKGINWPKEAGTDNDNIFVPLQENYQDDESYKEALKDFLTDKSKWVISDGDEYCTFKALLITGAFDDKKITNTDGTALIRIKERW